MRSRLTCAVAALALMAAPLHAQSRPVSVGVSGGLSIPTGDLSDGAETGFNVTGHLILRPASLTNLSFRGDVSYDRMNLKNADGNFSILGVSANALYDIPMEGSTVRPYVLGGLGYYNGKSTVTVGNVSASSSDGNAGFQLGAGISFALSGFSTFLEAKYVNVMSDPNSSAFIPITFGIKF